VFCNSGSSANLLALLSLDLEPGYEVITPALTFSTTVAPILQTNGKPVFIDTHPLTFVPSVEEVLKKITTKTRVILLPNLAGAKPNWKELKKRLDEHVINKGDKPIYLIEDSCDTMAHTPESYISTTSFYASHVITAGGLGGMVMFNQQSLVKRCLQYRDWGRLGDNSEVMQERFAYNVDGIPYDYKFLYSVVGYNFKASEMNASFGLVQMSKLKSFLEKRKNNIKTYVERLKGSSFLLPLNSENYDWLAMPLLHKNRKRILEYLEQNGVQTRVFFAGNITRHPAYRSFLQEFKDADTVMEQGFLLGAHHGLEEEDIHRVCDLLLEAEKL
jgi:CDP-4-dehydro-6-deoxyglucose reductase, E1